MEYILIFRIFKILLGASNDFFQFFSKISGKLLFLDVEEGTGFKRRLIKCILERSGTSKFYRYIMFVC